MNRFCKALVITAFLVPSSVWADLASDLATHQTSYATYKDAVGLLGEADGQNRINTASSIKANIVALQSNLAALDLTGATQEQTDAHSALVAHAANLSKLCDDHGEIGSVMVDVADTLTLLHGIGIEQTYATNIGKTTSAKTLTAATLSSLSSLVINANTLTSDEELGSLATATKSDFDMQSAQVQPLADLADKTHTVIVKDGDLNASIAVAPYQTVTNASVLVQLADASSRGEAVTASTDNLAQLATSIGEQASALLPLATAYAARVAPRTTLAAAAVQLVQKDTAFLDAQKAIPLSPPSTNLTTGYITPLATAMDAATIVIDAAPAVISSATSLGDDGAALVYFAEKVKLNAEYRKDDNLLNKLKTELALEKLSAPPERISSGRGGSSPNPAYTEYLATIKALQVAIDELALKINNRNIQQVTKTTTAIVEPTPPTSTADMGAYVDEQKARYAFLATAAVALATDTITSSDDPAITEKSTAIIDATVATITAFTDVLATVLSMIMWSAVPPSDNTVAQAEWNGLISLYNNYRQANALSSLEATLDAGETTMLSLFDGTPNYALIQAPLAQLLADVGAKLESDFLVLIQEAITQALTAPATSTVTSTTDNASPSQIPEEPSITLTSHTTFSEEINDGIGSHSSLLLSGDNDGFGRLRELAVNPTDDKINADIQIYMNKSAHVGLGSANLGNNPGQTLNVLGATGENSVQVIPDGNCVVYLNSDVTIAGPHPIVPTENFGKGTTHRITFTSEKEVKLIVAAGTEWDLSAFGSDGDQYGAFSKQIMFAGKVLVVLEPGATLRLPFIKNGKETKAPVLYFNDDSQLVFQGTKNRDLARWEGETVGGSDSVRCKLMGCGQFWMNKNSQVHIFSPALVGVQADATTKKTNIVFSLQRLSQFLIGTENKAGGALQVGNMEDIEGTDISFDITVNGPAARCFLGRESFLGFAAGVVNKDKNPNGSTPSKTTTLTQVEAHETQYDAWRIQRLHNVLNVTLNLKKGIFEHNNIADGSSSEASVLAVGPLMYSYPQAKYLLKLGNSDQIALRGGGNLVYVTENRTLQNPLPLHIWDSFHYLNGTPADDGAYSLLAPHTVIRSRRDSLSDASTSFYGSADVVANEETYTLVGPARGFYRALSMSDYVLSIYEPYTALGKSGFDTITGYMVGDTIVRQVVTTALDSSGNDVAPEQALSQGYLQGGRGDENGPIEFFIPG